MKGSQQEMSHGPRSQVARSGANHKCFDFRVGKDCFKAGKGREGFTTQGLRKIWLSGQDTSSLSLRIIAVQSGAFLYENRAGEGVKVIAEADYVQGLRTSKKRGFSFSPLKKKELRRSLFWMREAEQHLNLAPPGTEVGQFLQQPRLEFRKPETRMGTPRKACIIINSKYTRICWSLGVKGLIIQLGRQEDNTMTKGLSGFGIRVSVFHKSIYRIYRLLLSPWVGERVWSLPRAPERQVEEVLPSQSS